tara:strand:- start:965 stop:3343 length:2379 start_codon:yes stop_codon:yes gene_type:complete
MERNKDKFIVVILFLVIICITFYELISGSKVLVSGDTLSPIAIKKAVANATLNYNTYPLWSPWLLGGMPTIHSLLNISDSYYLHKFYLNVVHFFDLAWIWNFLFHIIFGCYGMFKLLNFLKISKYSSFIVSVSFFIMPYMTAMLVHGHGSQVMTICYMPWIIYYLFKSLNQTKIIDFAFLSLLIGLQLQRGHIQIAYYTWMMIGLFILLNYIYSYIKSSNQYIFEPKNYIYLFLALLGGVLLSLNLYLPILNYSDYSIRGMNDGGAGILYSTQWSFSLKEALTFIYPSAVGFGGAFYQSIGSMPFTDYPNYFSILLFAFAIIGLLKKNYNIYRIFFIFVIIFSFLLSLGKNFISFYSIFYDFLPYFNKFRSPVFILILFNFSLSIFAAYGIDYVFINIRKKINNNLFFLIISILIILLISINFLSQTFIPAQYNYKIEFLELLKSDLIHLLFILFILVLALIFIQRYKKYQSFLYFIVLTLCVYDLNRINYEIINPINHIPNKRVVQSKEYLQNYLKEDDAIKFISFDKDLFRIYDPIGQNRWSAFNHENILGYHPAKLSSYERLKSTIEAKNFDIWPLGILRLLNVKYLVFPHNPNNSFENDYFKISKSNISNYYFGNHPVYDGKLISIDILEFNDRLPRLFYVNKLSYLNDKNKIYDLITNHSFNPSLNSFIITNDLEEDIFFDNVNQSVTIEKWSPNEIHFNTETTTEQFLVMSELYFPYGWKLTNDNKEVKIHEVNNLVRGFFVPKGKNSFIMEFEPEDVMWGNRLSLLSLTIILLLIFIFYRKKENV